MARNNTYYVYGRLCSSECHQYFIMGNVFEKHVMSLQCFKKIYYLARILTTDIYSKTTFVGIWSFTKLDLFVINTLILHISNLRETFYETNLKGILIKVMFNKSEGKEISYLCHRSVQMDPWFFKRNL